MIKKIITFTLAYPEVSYPFNNQPFTPRSWWDGGGVISKQENWVMKVLRILLVFLCIVGAVSCKREASYKVVSHIYQIENDRVIKYVLDENDKDKIIRLGLKEVKKTHDYLEGETSLEEARIQLGKEHAADWILFKSMKLVSLKEDGSDLMDLVVDSQIVSVHIDNDFLKYDVLETGYSITIAIDFTQSYDVESMTQLLEYFGVSSDSILDNGISLSKLQSDSGFAFSDVFMNGQYFRLEE